MPLVDESTVLNDIESLGVSNLCSATTSVVPLITYSNVKILGEQVLILVPL